MQWAYSSATVRVRKNKKTKSNQGLPLPGMWIRCILPYFSCLVKLKTLEIICKTNTGSLWKRRQTGQGPRHPQNDTLLSFLSFCSASSISELRKTPTGAELRGWGWGSTRLVASSWKTGNRAAKQDIKLSGNNGFTPAKYHQENSGPLFLPTVPAKTKWVFTLVSL